MAHRSFLDFTAAQDELNTALLAVNGTVVVDQVWYGAHELVEEERHVAFHWSNAETTEYVLANGTNGTELFSGTLYECCTFMRGWRACMNHCPTTAQA